MDQLEHLQENDHEATNGPAIQEPAYPPKYERAERSRDAWFTSVLSLAAWLILGYYIFPSYKILLLITVVVILHELGHFFAMKIFRYKDLGIFFIPLLGAYVSGSKREVSQRESAIILLAGPVPGILIGIGFYLLYLNDFTLAIAGIPFSTIGISFLLLNLINLVPVYPLDGGQLLNRVFLNEDSVLSKIFVVLSIGFMVWFAIWGGSRPYYPLLLFPFMIITRMFGDSRSRSMEKKIQETGVDMDISYEGLSDADYWKVRDVVVAEEPAFREIPAGPPYEYHEKENKVMVYIQALLHRHLLQDLSIVGKLLIIVLWAGAFALPWLLGIYQHIVHQFRY